MKLLRWFIDFVKLIWNTEPKPLPMPEEQKLNPIWYSIALEELGQSEVMGPGNNPRILQYHSVTTLKATTDLTPWCAAFACWCLEKAGIESPRSAKARDFLKWGKPITDPYKGCIAVFSSPTRGGEAGHVGFYLFDTSTDIMILSGNSNDKVRIHTVPKNQFLGYRSPT